MDAQILVNGEARPWRAIGVLQLLRGEGLDPARKGIAVALNGALLPRRAWPETSIEPNDRIEIVRPHAGG